jgi:hypothetical protein
MIGSINGGQGSSWSWLRNGGVKSQNQTPHALGNSAFQCQNLETPTCQNNVIRSARKTPQCCVSEYLFLISTGLLETKSPRLRGNVICIRISMTNHLQSVLEPGATRS